MKKIILPFLLVIGIFLSFLYLVFSYTFTDVSILLMLEQTKPGILNLIGDLQQKVSPALTNQTGLVLLIVLSLSVVIVVLSKKAISNAALILAILIPSLLVFAYPMVSRDIFSYLFYPKMILVYQQNPYLTAPAIYWGTDMWLGFLHNVERVYAYGPVALLLNLIPMAIVGAEKFIVNVYLLKITSLLFFMFGGWLLIKITRNRNLTVVLWLINPFIINELLINGHNDLMMIVFFWLAIYLKQKSKTLMSLLAFTLSVGTKYVTGVLFPIFFLPKKLQEFLALSSIVVITSYFIYNGNLPWYFTWIYFCLPYLKLNKPQIFSLLFLQLTLTLVYSGFLQNGLWGTYSSSQVIVTIIKSIKLFVPLFVLSTIYPYFRKNLNFHRSS